MQNLNYNAASLLKS